MFRATVGCNQNCLKFICVKIYTDLVRASCEFYHFSSSFSLFKGVSLVGWPSPEARVHKMKGRGELRVYVSYWKSVEKKNTPKVVFDIFFLQKNKKSS